MTSRNLAIVWAPNLLRPNNQDCLRDCGLQALVIEAMIVYFEEIFEAETECVTRRNFTKEVSIDQVWVANCQLYCRSYRVFIKEGQKVNAYHTVKICLFGASVGFIWITTYEHLFIYTNDLR